MKLTEENLDYMAQTFLGPLQTTTDRRKGPGLAINAVWIGIGGIRALVCIAREESIAIGKAVIKAITVMKAVALATKAATMKVMKAVTMKAAVTNR
jgi:hypothetical protein